MTSGCDSLTGPAIRGNDDDNVFYRPLEEYAKPYPLAHYAKGLDSPWTYYFVDGGKILYNTRSVSENPKVIKDGGKNPVKASFFYFRRVDGTSPCCQVSPAVRPVPLLFSTILFAVALYSCL